MSDNGGADDKTDRSGHLSWGDGDLDFGDNKSSGSDEAPMESSDYQKEAHSAMLAEGYTFVKRDGDVNVYQKGVKTARIGK